MQIRYKGMNPEIEIPAFRLVVKRGEPFAVSEEQARSVLRQVDNFEPVDAEAKALVKTMAKEDQERDAPDQTIVDAVEGVGRAVA